VSRLRLPIVSSDRFSDTFRALKHRNYRLFYSGQVISLCGTWMQTIAQAWLVLELTDSRVALGTVTLLQFLPITIFVLFAGVVADRVPKRSFLVAVQSLAMTQAVVLSVLVFTDVVELWHVYVLAFVLGLSVAFEQPTRQAFVIEMVGKEDLMNAVALNAGAFNGARLIGPAIGGAVIAIAGVETAFAINAVSFLPVITGLLLMRMSELHAVDTLAVRRSGALAELGEGISYALRTPSILMILMMVAVIGTFGYNFIVVLPLLARYVLGTGSTGFGFLTAAVGLGALFSALFLAGNRRASRRILFTGCTAFTILLALVGLSTSLYVTLFLLLLLGVANTAFAATANTSLQIAAPDYLRGRVMSLFFLLIAGSTPIGGFLTGFLAEQIGTQSTVVVLAALCGVGVAVGAIYYATHRDAVQQTAEAPAPAIG
jgi:MFS family permease